MNIGEMLVRGGELLFQTLFLKDSSTFTATIILFLFFSLVFFNPIFMEGLSHYINFFRSSPSYTCSSSKPILEYVVAAFPLDISVFLSSPYMPKVYPHHWRLLEGRLSHPNACSTDIRPIRGG